MKPRYTIRDMFILALLVALAVGWLTDHRREEQVIKLLEERERYQDKLISQSQGTFEVIGSSLKSQFQRIQGIEATIKMLAGEIRMHYPPLDRKNNSDAAATQ